jgi:hypothetical protein
VPVPFGWRLQSDEAVSSLRLPAEGKSHARLFVDFLPYPGSLDDLERRYDAVGGELPWERSPVHRRVAIGGRDALLTTHTVLGWRILNAHVPWRGGLLMASLRVHVDTLEEQWTPARAALLDIEFAPR